MRKLMMLACVVVLIASTVSAQLPAKPFNFYVTAGGSIAQSPDIFEVGFKTGYHLGGALGFSVGAVPGLQLVGKVDYNNFGADMAGPAVMNGDAPDVRFLTYGLDARFALGAPLVPIKPFILAGVGIAELSFSDVSGTLMSFYNALPGEDSRFYYNVGGGLEIMSTPAFSFFVQGRFVSVFIEGGSWQYIPVSLGVKF